MIKPTKLIKPAYKLYLNTQQAAITLRQKAQYCVGNPFATKAIQIYKVIKSWDLW